MLRYLLVAGLAAAIAAPAQADFESILGPKDWNNSEAQDPILQTITCQASTVVSDSTETIELTLSYPKDEAILPAIFLRTKLNPALITAKLSKNKSAELFLLRAAATNEEPNTYWYSPSEFADFETAVRALNVLELSTGAKVSLRGSSAAVDAAKKCLGKTPFPKAFFQLLNADKGSLNPDLGDRSPSTLFQAVQNSYDAYRAGAGIQASLEVLRKPVQPLLKKEAAAQAVLDAKQKAMDVATTKLSAARQLVADLQTKLAASKDHLAALQTEKPLAEKDLAEKTAIYSPKKKAMGAYEQRIANAQKAIAGYQAAISKNEGLIAANDRTIRNLQAELAKLQKDIPYYQSQANALVGPYNQADSEYRSYNKSYERQRALDSDYNYSSGKRDRDDAQRDYQRAQSDSYSAQSELSSAQSRASQCRSKPDNPNCSSEDSDVSRANQKVWDAQSRMSRAQSDQSSAESKIRNAESDADRKVNNEEDRLLSIRNDLANRYNGFVSALNAAQSRASAIRSSIPNLKGQNDRARSAIADARQKLANSQAELAQAKADKGAFAISIGFDEAEKNFTDATAHLKETVAGIATETKAIPATTSSLAKATKAVPPLEKALVAATSSRDSASGKLAEASAPLKGFREEEAKVLAQLSAEKIKFETNRALFQDLTKYLAEAGGR